MSQRRRLEVYIGIQDKQDSLYKVLMYQVCLIAGSRRKILYSVESVLDSDKGNLEKKVAHFWQSVAKVMRRKGIITPPTVYNGVVLSSDKEYKKLEVEEVPSFILEKFKSFLSHG